MNVIHGQVSLVEKFKEDYKFIVVPIYKDFTLSIVYTIYLEDHKRRRSQIKRNIPPHSWIIMSTARIANKFKINTREYRNFLMSHGGEYIYSIGICFSSEEQCQHAIDKLYEKIIYGGEI